MPNLSGRFPAVFGLGAGGDVHPTAPVGRGLGRTTHQGRGCDKRGGSVGGTSDDKSTEAGLQSGLVESCCILGK